MRSTTTSRSSNGPYKIQEYTKGNAAGPGAQRELEHGHRHLPSGLPGQDRGQVRPRTSRSSTSGMIQDAGEDQQRDHRVTRSQPSNLATGLQRPGFADRRVNELRPVRPLHTRSTSRRCRTSSSARRSRSRSTGRSCARSPVATFAGDLADGVIKPNLPADYAPSGMWTGLLGQTIPDTGDPAYAKQLIAESGEPMPTITVRLPADADERQGRRRRQVVAGEGRHQGQAEPDRGRRSTTAIVFDPDKAGDLMCAGWGPDWPNASTVIPPLFTPTGGCDLSQVNDKAFNAKVDAAPRRDRPRRAGRAVEGAQQGGHGAGLGRPDPLRQATSAWRARRCKSASGKNGQVYIVGAVRLLAVRDLYVEQ